MSGVPQNIELEERLLGTVLWWPEEAIKACWSAGLRAEDFGRPAHGVVFDAACRSLKAGGSADALTVGAMLQREEVPAERGKTVNALEFVGGHTGLRIIEERHGEVATARQHAEEVVSLALSRELLKVAETLAEEAQKLAPVPDVVTAAERRLAAARDRADGRTAGKNETDIAELVQRFLKQYASSEPDDLIPFPLPTLNALGGGMAAGDIVIVGARSGVGKSWWALDTIENSVRRGSRCALMSLEMPKDQMTRRLMGMGGLNLTGLKKRALPYDALIDRAGMLDGWRGLLDIHDGPTNVDRIHSVLSSARIDGNPYRVLVVDHLHLLDIPGRGGEYRINLNTALTRLKHAAVEHGITLVLLAQLVKPGQGERGRRPTIFDLRESNAIGDIADYVLLLHREPGEDGHPSNTGVVIVDKVRDGAGACDIDVIFDPRTYRFTEGYMAGAFNNTRSIA